MQLPPNVPNKTKTENINNQQMKKSSTQGDLQKSKEAGKNNVISIAKVHHFSNKNLGTKKNSMK